MASCNLLWLWRHGMATKSPEMPLIDWSENCWLDTILIHHLQETKVSCFTHMPQIEIRMENWSFLEKKLIYFQLSFKKKMSYSFSQEWFDYVLALIHIIGKYIFRLFNDWIVHVMQADFELLWFHHWEECKIPFCFF